jgi:hypothetical protein
MHQIYGCVSCFRQPGHKKFHPKVSGIVGMYVKFNFVHVFAKKQATFSVLAYQLNQAQWTRRLSYTLWNNLTIRCCWEKEQNIAITTANDDNYLRSFGIILEVPA